MVGLPRRGERLTHDSLPRAEFGFPRTDLRRRLVDAILRGEKTSTTGLLVDYERDGEAPGAPGERSVVVDAEDREVAIIELTEVTVRRMADVDLAFAIEEGEGFTTVAEWREAHEQFWSQELDDIRTHLRDPSWQLTDDTMVVCERFCLVDRL